MFDNAADLAAYRDMKALKCRVEGCADGTAFSKLASLTAHLKSKHGVEYCMLCEASGGKFLGEMELFTPEALASHCEDGDKTGRTPFKGHPLCEFCNSSFYDADALFFHLKDKHFHCHCCSTGVAPVYFADADTLQAHYNEEHFPCAYGECVAKRHIVFRTEEDRAAHYKIVHTSSMGKFDKSKARVLEVNIEYRRDQPEPYQRFLRDQGIHGSEDRAGGAGPSGSGGGGGTGGGKKDKGKKGKGKARDAEGADAGGASGGDATAGGVLSVLGGMQPERAVVEENRAADALRERNRGLMKIMKDVLGPSREGDFIRFREVSAKYRDGVVGVEEFYVEFCAVFGAEFTPVLIPVLNMLQPDEGKKAELARFHEQQVMQMQAFPSLPKKHSSGPKVNRDRPLDHLGPARMLDLTKKGAPVKVLPGAAGRPAPAPAPEASDPEDLPRTPEAVEKAVKDLLERTAEADTLLGKKDKAAGAGAGPGTGPGAPPTSAFPPASAAAAAAPSSFSGPAPTAARQAIEEAFPALPAPEGKAQRQQKPPGGRSFVHPGPALGAGTVAELGEALRPESIHISSGAGAGGSAASGGGFVSSAAPTHAPRPTRPPVLSEDNFPSLGPPAAAMPSRSSAQQQQQQKPLGSTQPDFVPVKKGGKTIMKMTWGGK